MAEHTPRLELPYPAETETPDVPRDIKALAEALDKIIAPPGTLRLTAAVTLETGWLNCEGQAVSRTTYSALFAAIGTAYGEGDKSTTFNLPDYRERVPVGSGAGTARGAKGGEATHVLSEAELASHGHHVIPFDMGGGELLTNGGDVVASAVAGSGQHVLQATTNGGGFWTGLVAQNAGGGGAHNNMQPYTASNVWIKT